MLVLIPLLVAFASPPQAESPLLTLLEGHPRLIALDSDLDRVRSLMKTDARAGEMYTRLRGAAEKLIGQPTVEYKIIGPRLLAESRRCLDRVYTLALLWRLDGDKRFRDRAVKELRAAADFPDWNPSHFLDTAEMTHAFAIGYDWLYSALSPAEREWIRRAIVQKGLDAAIPIYKDKRSWTRVRHNWNQVCNGGIGIGALAVAEDEPERADFILRNALESIRLPMAEYGPDGGWGEGPGYWHYATRYNVYFLAALETALASDFELSKIRGFSRAGHFRVYFCGPSGQTFNYADASSGTGGAAEMFWLARRFREPVYSWHQQQQFSRSGVDALDLVWFGAQALTPKESNWPLNAVFRGVEVAFLRSGWDDPNAVFLGIKGGDNKTNHSHLDLGSFVLDSGGIRWAIDLGGDDYNLPAYFGPKRWTYYRLRTESHNLVMIDAGNQDPKAAARIVEQELENDRARVRIDLTAAYPEKLERHMRQVSLINRQQVLVEDEVSARQPVEALWGMLTEAEISLNGQTATLRQSGRAMKLEIASPQKAVFETMPAAPGPPQNQNVGVRKLAVRLPGKVTQTRITVKFTALSGDSGK